MAAIAAALGITVKAGDEIVAHHALYGCTYSLLTNWMPRMGVSVRYGDFMSVMNTLQGNGFYQVALINEEL